MRVALVHVRHAATGGTEGYLNRLARRLAQRGHEVTIVCRSHAAAPHPRVRFLVLRPPALGAAWRTWSFARAVERELAPSRSERAPERSELAPERSERSGAGPRGDRRIDRARFDVVLGLGRTWTQDVLRLGGGCHATFLERVLATSPSPADRLEARLRPRHRVALAIEARALAPAASPLVIANSEMVARDVAARHGVARERLHVVRNGVDVERFHPRRRAEGGARVRREAGADGPGPVLLFLGSGFARKGLDLLLPALPALLARRPDARLLVVGRDARAARYAALARRLGVEGAVRFLGHRADAPDCFAAADLYVLPTRYDAFANATVEALASGVPVVTTDANGGAEVVGGDAGEVVPLEAIEERLPAALVAWSDPERLRAARAAARARGEACSAERELTATEEILRRAAPA